MFAQISLADNSYVRLSINDSYHMQGQPKAKDRILSSIVDKYRPRVAQFCTLFKGGLLLNEIYIDISM